MQALDTRRRAILADLVERLREIEGVCAIVLGGSWARGRARPDSDLDVGLYYEGTTPLDVDAVRALARELSPDRAETVTDLWAWGPWVNGGAWLTIENQPVDLLYRELDQQRDTLEAAERGEYELHFGQQPPFGFFSPTLLGEIEVAHVLHDPGNVLAPLKERVATYPEALRARVIGDFLWSAEFALEAFARKSASRGDSYLTTATLARVCHALTLVLFALNRVHLLNDKTALDEIDAFECHPGDFGERVREILGATGTDEATLGRSVDTTSVLFEECVDLAGELYVPRFHLRNR